MQRLNELIEMGAGIPHSPNDAFYADHTALTTWRTASIAFLERVVGPKDAYTRLFIQEADGWYYSAASSGTGILKQVKHDLEGDYLLRISQLIAGELVADVWSQAAELLDVHFKDAAANLAGAALEVGLRQIAMAHGVDVEGQRGIDALNRSLAKAQVFTAVRHQQVDAWRVLRNAAAHGDYAQYSEDDVRHMLEGVQAVLADELG